MRVQYFTFVLNPTDQQVLFKEKKTKMEIFKEIILSEKPIKFNSHGVSLALVNVFKNSNYAIFRLGRQELVQISRSPEEKFELESISNWPHCLLFIDFSEDPTGHKIAIEYKADIFKEPYVQLQALAKELNSNLSILNYLVEINAVTTERKFWETVDENENQIKKLVMTFNSPNFLKLTTKLNDELKNIEKEFGATKTTIEIENPEGKLRIPKNSELIKQGAEYITHGGGSYKFKVRKQSSYIKDKDNIETKEVVDIDLSTSDSNIILQVLDKIFNKNA